ISLQSVDFVFNKVEPSPEVVRDILNITFKLKNFSSNDLFEFLQKNTAKISYEAVIKSISESEGEYSINHAFEFLKKKIYEF
ncbi:hypothetical protein, partial [Holospora obtusa]|uniref:hypothetical protein n=1 Tax=Holospora obtusa TaxID=49893 RepID=UPI0005913502